MVIIKTKLTKCGEVVGAILIDKRAIQAIIFILLTRQTVVNKKQIYIQYVVSTPTSTYVHKIIVPEIDIINLIWRNRRNGDVEQPPK